MHWINWLVIVAYLVWVVGDGIRRSRGSTNIQAYFLANRSLPWWAVGLSVMATQLSAITLIGTTGQGATDGLRFVQFYFGLPLAMVILGVTIVPFLHGAKVYTAYEYLERRFNPATRSLTSFLFLCSRGLSAGTIIAAPAVIFSAVLGWDLWLSVAVIGLPTIAYTAIGGVGAVTWADVKQMFVIVLALLGVVGVLVWRMPVPMDDALAIAGATGRMQVFDFSFDMSQTYTFWSGVIGGTFLMLSYFGADQSQVQRYLAARSVDEARSSLLMSAYWKIPLQALVLLVGVLVFLFYTFEPSPLLWNPTHDRAARAAAPAEFAEFDQRYGEALNRRREVAASIPVLRDREQPAAADAALQRFREADAAATAVRAEALTRAEAVIGAPTRDVNYIMPRFVLDYLPLGLAGLFLAAVLAAAMSSIAAELNSLATASVVDFYQRWFRRDASDAHYLRAGRVMTGVWGLVACLVATQAATLGSLIEVVNRFGSFFYGSILGVFLLAMIPWARGLGAVVGLVAGMSTVAAVTFGAPQVSFLWHNVIGAVTVVAVGALLSVVVPRPRG